LLEYLYRLVSGPQASPDGLFSNPRSIAEILFMMSMGSEGKRMLSRYLDDRFSQLHVSVRIRNSPDTTIGETIEKVRSAAQSAMGGAAKAVVTGDLAVFEAQASEIVSSQTYSLLLAVFYMSVLLTIQFRSIALGLASLLPQLLPQAVIFGIMGWFRISLDSVTVFAASVSIGLTVDNTVHYLTQLKREIRAGDRSRDIESCLSAAYEVTARAMISNHAVIFFGFAMLLFSPFRPVIAFGILGCAAIFFSLVGDLIFMPSVILSSTLFRRLLTREMTAR
jgi:predicted RND superfamily exporter protein